MNNNINNQDRAIIIPLHPKTTAARPNESMAVLRPIRTINFFTIA